MRFFQGFFRRVGLQSTFPMLHFSSLLLWLGILGITIRRFLLQRFLWVWVWLLRRTPKSRRLDTKWNLESRNKSRLNLDGSTIEWWQQFPSLYSAPRLKFSVGTGGAWLGHTRTASTATSTSLTSLQISLGGSVRY